MSDTVLLLGPVVFRDFEVPSGINFGGKQRLALHRLPGGTRIIDALGRDDAQITFSGIFSDSDATLRARSLDELRSIGLPLALTWDIFFYTVLIRSFHADYRNSWWIPYSITCTVVRDEASALVQPLISLATAALADIGYATTDALNARLDLAPLQAALGTPGSTVRGTAAYSTTQFNFNATRTSMDVSIGAADTRLGEVDLTNVLSPDVGAARLLEATSIAGQLSSLTSARSYISRAAASLANAST